MLQITRLKRVALAEIASLVTTAEPADALFGTAVGKRIGHDVTARAALESVVTNRGSRAHRFLDIAGFDNALDPVGIPRPNAGQKIGLQLETDRKLIVFGFTDSTAHGLDTIGNAEKILHVMSHFVCYHVGLREIASCPQALLK